jgi:hypothetical protein
MSKGPCAYPWDSGPPFDFRYVVPNALGPLAIDTIHPVFKVKFAVLYFDKKQRHAPVYWNVPREVR